MLFMVEILHQKNVLSVKSIYLLGAVLNPKKCIQLNVPTMDNTRNIHRYRNIGEFSNGIGNISLIIYAPITTASEDPRDNTKWKCATTNIVSCNIMSNIALAITTPVTPPNTNNITKQDIKNNSTPFLPTAATKDPF